MKLDAILQCIETNLHLNNLIFDDRSREELTKMIKSKQKNESLFFANPEEMIDSPQMNLETCLQKWLNENHKYFESKKVADKVVQKKGRNGLLTQQSSLSPIESSSRIFSFH